MLLGFFITKINREFTRRFIKVIPTPCIALITLCSVYLESCLYNHVSLVNTARCVANVALVSTHIGFDHTSNAILLYRIALFQPLAIRKKALLKIPLL